MFKGRDKRNAQSENRSFSTRTCQVAACASDNSREMIVDPEFTHGG